MNTNFLNSLTNFLKKRTFEFAGLLLISSGIALTISFVTYSPTDPSFIYGENNTNIQNFLVSMAVRSLTCYSKVSG